MKTALIQKIIRAKLAKAQNPQCSLREICGRCS